MTVNPSTMRLGIASILVGLVGAYGVRVMMEEEEVAAVTTEPKKAFVPTASADLPAGRTLRKADIQFRPMTQDEMIQEGWQLSSVIMDEGFIIDRLSKRSIRAGQPFLTTDVWLDGESPEIPPKAGMRAVPLRVANDRGGSQATTSDKVDLFFTSTFKKAENGRQAIPEKTILLAEGVNVLHVEYPQLSEIQWAVGYKEKAPIFTLEVEPGVAGKIQTVQPHGDFSLLVRASDDPKGRNGADGEYSLEDILGIEEPVQPQVPPHWTTTYVKGTGGSYQRHFPIPHQPAPQPVAQRQPAPKKQVEEVMPEPTPAERQPARTPRIPYRPDEPTVRPPAQTPTPARDPAPSDPFSDDGEVLP